MNSKGNLANPEQRPLEIMPAEEFGNLFYKLFEEKKICKERSLSPEKVAMKFGCSADELDRRLEDVTGLTLDMVISLYRSQI